MKKLPAIIALFISFCSYGQAIPLDSFYTVGATWTMSWSWHFQRGSSRWEAGIDKVIYKITSDLTVSGKNYHILSVGYGARYYEDFDGYHYSSRVSYTDSPAFTYFGRLRTDSNRVYFIRDVNLGYGYCPPLIGQENLLYDFNLSLGSTVLANDVLRTDFFVSSMDSVALSNGTLIKKYADTFYHDYWLYGIGSVSGLLPDLYWRLFTCGPGPTGGERSLCYENPSFSYKFELPSTHQDYKYLKNCFDLKEVGTVVIQKRPISFYPNPLTNNSLYFDGDDLQNINHLSVHDITGKSLYVFTDPFSNGNKRLYTPLAPGIYLIKYDLDGQIVTSRLVRL